ncbi:hypothetical protein Agub_g9748 [Astrephomene gubernaculifera]|uniref:RRM domain-containing protein n=1 Tax=Astrephomene gubernaculifera TaxID=47775 RepID=A0AAD3HNH9_9CHLO|nr:hypothetical protein Agub_g9748 [Astrephomene gubernaculifera]
MVEVEELGTVAPKGDQALGDNAEPSAGVDAQKEQGGNNASVPDHIESDGSSSDDGSEDSDDSSGDIDVDAETAQKLMTLEHELQTNPTYEKHLEYITLLRETPGLRTRLRDAYEAFAASFPLSAELWLGWVNDELAGGAVAEPEQVSWLLGLLRRAATRDYLAPGVWELYLDVAHDLDPAVRELQPEGVERYRSLCEEALAAAGLHLGEGHRIWDKYRKFELAVEAKLAAAAGAAGGGGGAASRQQDRVRALYQRQLQVPLQDGSATLEEYKAWEAGHGKSVPAHVAKAAEKAREAADVRAGCEAAVAPDLPYDVTKLGAFMSYINMEQKGGDAARVQVVYERAVAAFPLTHSLWLQYGQYLETHTKLPGPINDVYGRAVRNCPWVGAVWERAIRALDRTAAPQEAVDEVYGRALQAGLQNPEDVLSVVLARLDFLRRRAVEAGATATSTAAASAAACAALREAFQAASELMMSHFPDYLDRSLRLPAYWAHCEEHVAGSVAAAREVWEGAIKGGLGRFAEVWEAYIGMERAGRRIKEARALYKRCYSRRFEEDGQLRLCHAWLRFEREEGSADDYLQALLKVEPILEENAAAAVAAADPAAAAAAKAAVQRAKNLSKEEMRAMRQAKDPNFLKESKETKTKKDKDVKGGKVAKRVRQDDGQGTLAPAEGDDIATLEPAKRVRMHEPEPAADAAPQAAAADPDGDAEMGEQHEEAAAHEDHAEAVSGGDHDAGEAAGPGPGTKAAQGAARPHYTDKLTVFIKGLRTAVKDEELAAFLRQHVPDGVKDIRVPRDHETGQARGFAYVECSSREALDKAVSLNGSSFQGLQLFIAESKPPGHAGPGGRGGGRGRFGGAPPPGGRGTFRGRGRGFGGRGAGGGGEGGNEDAEMEDVGEGGGRGGRGGSRGGRHPGLGHPRGRGQMRTHLQMAQGTKPPTALVPRSVQLGGSGGAAAEGGGGSGQPLSNDDFRKMLLAGKK